MDVVLPNGVTIRGIPEGTTKEQVMQKAISAGLAKQEDFGVTPPQEDKAIAVNPFSGIGGMASQYGFSQQNYDKSKQEMESRLAALPEGQAEIIRDMTPVERTLANVGAGFTDVYYGLPGTGKNPNLDIANQLTEATDGGLARAVGQAAPFAPAALAAGGLAVGGRAGAIAGQALVGGIEGATIASGTGGDAIEGGLVGAGIGAGAEVLAPAINRVAGPLIRRIKGAAPSVPPVGPDLTPSPELKSVMDETGITMDDLIKESGAADLTKDVAGAASSGAEQRVSELASNITTNPARVAAAERLDVQAPLATLTDQQPIHEIVGAAAAVPGSRTNEELVRFSRDLTKRAEDLIEQTSGYLDKEVVSENLKTGMQDQIAQLTAKSSDIYKQIDSAVPPDTIVNAKQLRQEIARRGAKSQKGVGGLSKVEQDVFSALQGKPTYFDLDRLRRDIGASIGRTEGTYTNEQSSILKDMYSKITELQEGVADQVGGGAGDLWRQAKDMDKARFALQENSEFLFGKNNVGSIMPKLESSLSMLAKGNNKPFKDIVASIPDAQRPAVISGAIDSVLRKSYAGDVRLDANGFAKWYNQLSRSETNKRTLMNELPEGAEARLDDLYLLAQGLSNVTNNRVRTGVVNSIFKQYDNADGFVAKLYNISNKAAETPVVGAAIGPAGRVIAATAKMAAKEKTPSIQAADELLASDAFRSAVLSMDLPAKKRVRAMRRLESTDAYKKYLAAQNKTRAAQIASMGLIPFLASEEEDQ